MSGNFNLKPENGEIVASLWFRTQVSNQQELLRTTQFLKTSVLSNFQSVEGVTAVELAETTEKLDYLRGVFEKKFQLIIHLSDFEPEDGSHQSGT